MDLDRVAGAWSRRRFVIDASIAAIAGAMATLNVISQYDVNAQVGAPIDTSRTLSYALVWLCAAPLALRRTTPELAFVATTLAFMGTRLWAVPEPTVTVVMLAVAYISLGVHGCQRWRTPLRASVTVALVAVYVYVAVRTVRQATLGSALAGALAFDVALGVILILAVWAFGDTYRTRFEHARDLEARTIELDEQRSVNAERAVVDERLRIARELHDVLAHHVSVMGVQAAAAGRVLDRDPGSARRALATIEDSSRDAIDEFRRLVGFLRSGTDTSSDGPQPCLDRCGELIADARRDGLDVRVSAVGDPRPLPPGVDLSAFRIIQEALTSCDRASP